MRFRPRIVPRRSFSDFWDLLAGRRSARRPVDIGDLLKGMRDLIDSSVGPKIEVRMRCASDLQPALVDPNQLELAILNLTRQCP